MDSAKLDYAELVGGERGVKIWGYAEVNRVSGSVLLALRSGWF